MTAVRWEPLEHNHCDYLYRMEVPGGWLVKLVEEHYTPGPGPTPAYDVNTAGIVFVPDPLHGWLAQVDKPPASDETLPAGPRIDE